MYKQLVNRDTQKNSNILQYAGGIFYECVLGCLNCTKIMKLPYHSHNLKNIFLTKYCMNSIYNLLTGLHKIIRMYEGLGLENGWDASEILLCIFCRVYLMRNSLEKQSTGLLKINHIHSFVLDWGDVCWKLSEYFELNF